MNEEQWVSCSDPIRMLEFLRGNPSWEDTNTWWKANWRFDERCRGEDRKFRLFACACCRRIWEQIPEPCNREAVAAVEGYLEGELSGRALEAAFIASSAVEWKEDESGRRSEPGYWAVKYLGRGFYKMTAAASALVVSSKVVFMADEAYGTLAGHEFNNCFSFGSGVFLGPFRWPLSVPASVEVERDTQATLLRCIFGNPFRISQIDPGMLTWNDRTIVRLAQGIYDDRAFEQMPILGDALEEAGCTDIAILDHLRGPGRHARGCHVLDLLLGKS